MPTLRPDPTSRPALSPLNPRLNPVVQADGSREYPAQPDTQRRPPSRSPERLRETEDEETSPIQLLRQRTLDAHARPAPSAAAAARRLLGTGWPAERAGLNAMGLVVQTGGSHHLRYEAPTTVLTRHASATAPSWDALYTPLANGPRARMAIFHAPLQIGRDGRDAASAQAWLDTTERERVVATYDLQLPRSPKVPHLVAPLVRCFPHAPRTQAEEGVIARWQKRDMKATTQLLFLGTQRVIRRTARLRMQQYGLLPRLVTLGDEAVLTNHPFDVQAYRARRLEAAAKAGDKARGSKNSVVLVYADTTENRSFLRQENDFLARYAIESLHLDAGKRLQARGAITLFAFPGIDD